MKRLVSLAIVVTIALWALAVNATAQVPNQMQYQGYLTDDGGSPLDTTVDMEFVIYDDSIGLGTIWTETHLDVTVVDGLFEVILGSVGGVTGDVVDDSVRWLGITVGDDSEIHPRTKLVTVPYAFRVSTVDGATGGIISGDVAIQSDLDLDGDLRVTGKATIGTGNSNTADYAFVAGVDNSVVGPNATVGGGNSNRAFGFASVVGGGQFDTSSANYATVAGGHSNVGGASYSAVGGGRYNRARGDYSTIAGGYGNQIQSTGDYSYLFGVSSSLSEDSTFMVDMPHIRFGDETDGYEFPTEDGSPGQVMATDGSGQMSWVEPSGSGAIYWSVTDSVLYTNNYWGIARGGAGNVLYFDSALTMVNLGVSCTTGHVGALVYNHSQTVSGGRNNAASSNNTTVGGGANNKARNPNATVGGGSDNSADSSGCTVGGGVSNIAGAPYSTVGGGYGNVATGVPPYGYGTVGGGRHNTAAGEASTIAGGHRNYVEGYASAILGGYADTITATGDYSCLFGIASKLTQDSTFMVHMPHIRFGDEVDGYEFPVEDGAAGQVMQTDGSGHLSWTDVSSSGSGWIDDGSVVRLETSTDKVGIGDAAPDGAFEVNPDGAEDSGDEFVVKSNGDVSIGMIPAAGKGTALKEGDVGGGKAILPSRLEVRGDNQQVIYSELTETNADTNERAAIYGYRTRTVKNDGSGYGVGETNNAITGYNYWGDEYTFGVAGYCWNDYTKTGGVIGANHDASYWGALGYKDEAYNTWGVYTPNNTYLGGNVGIGTNDPSEKLDVVGNRIRLRASTDPGAKEIVLRTSGAGVDLNADNANLFMHSNSGNTIIQGFGGNVGIGTASPLSELTIHGGPDTDDAALTFDVDGTDWYVGVDDSYGDKLRIGSGSAVGSNVAITIESDGDVGIGTGMASRALDVVGGIEADGVEAESLRVDEVYFGRSSTVGRLIGSYLELGAVGSYGIIEMLGSDGITSIDLDAGSGRVMTKVLEITGGSDLAEPFAMSDENAIPKGALVVIDDKNPGQLKLSNRAYDTRVAGVVSGAGGINPGLTLSQYDLLQGGRHVALSGQVYALADASYGVITPGDLLTTSDTPGHAMKATDRGRAYGAVVGKAMTSLKEGQGLVLVLVNLQ